MVSQCSCPGCAIVLPEIEGPTHAYIESSPACWAKYGEVLAREYADPDLFAKVHRMSVDAYAVQHPGRPSPQSIQSVAVHLISLCTMIEKDASAPRLIHSVRGFGYSFEPRNHEAALEAVAG